MRSTKVQQKASKVGFDWPDISGAIDKIEEELSELKEAIDKKDFDKSQDELGDLLFSVVNVSRFIDVDSEEALTKSCDKFIRRFTLVEQLAKDRNVLLNDLSLSELDGLWDKAKERISTDT